MKLNFGTIAALAAAYYFVIKPRLQSAPRTGGGVKRLPDLEKVIDTGNVIIVPSAGAGTATKTGSGQPRQMPEPPVIELPLPKPPAKPKRVNLLPAAASRQ